jgi:hypothetical protein
LGGVPRLFGNVVWPGRSIYCVGEYITDFALPYFQGLLIVFLRFGIPFLEEIHPATLKAYH